MLSATERRLLLEYARRALAAALAGSPRPPPPAPPPGASPDFSRPAAVFVTLTRRADDELRGCIGTFAARLPLAEAVAEYAVAAATHDGRFEPVRLAELAGLRLKISVLSPPVPADPAAVVPGRHGIHVVGRGRWAGYSGCYLPEVATDFGMTREEFLTHCCGRKAGMAPEAWRDPAQAEVQVFTTEAFGEEGPP